MKDGYYWVNKYYDWTPEIAQLEAGCFWFHGDSESVPVDDPDIIIGDYIETPEKYK